MKLPKKITICEVGPRDGFQPEKTLISVADKVSIIDKVVASGIKTVEIGSFVHPKAIPQMASTDELAKVLPQIEGVEYRTLVTNAKGVERAVACGIHKIKLTHSASQAHNFSNFNKTIEETVAGFDESIKIAKENNIAVSAAISVAFGCPFEGKINLNKLKSYVQKLNDYKINEISLSDTTGMANPQLVYSVCLEMIKEFPQVNFILHLHDTRGMALANILAGMQAGVAIFDGAFAGLGGCPYAPGASGNIATEDIIHMLDEMGIETGVNLDKAIITAKLAQQIVGHSTDSKVLKAGKVSDLSLEAPKKQMNK